MPLLIITVSFLLMAISGQMNLLVSVLLGLFLLMGLGAYDKSKNSFLKVLGRTMALSEAVGTLFWYSFVSEMTNKTVFMDTFYVCFWGSIIGITLLRIIYLSSDETFDDGIIFPIIMLDPND